MLQAIRKCACGTAMFCAGAVLRPPSAPPARARDGRCSMRGLLARRASGPASALVAALVSGGAHRAQYTLEEEHESCFPSAAAARHGGFCLSRLPPLPVGARGRSSGRRGAGGCRCLAGLLHYPSRHRPGLYRPGAVSARPHLPASRGTYSRSLRPAPRAADLLHSAALCQRRAGDAGAQQYAQRPAYLRGAVLRGHGARVFGPASSALGAAPGSGKGLRERGHLGRRHLSARQHHRPGAGRSALYLSAGSLLPRLGARGRGHRLLSSPWPRWCGIWCW